MIRYYEKIGLIPNATRSGAGYRTYNSSDVHSLYFIRSARDLGFSVEKIMKLLALWRDRDRASADVKDMALAHAAGLKAKIAELQAMVQTLEYLANHCHGNDRPDCPIIENLAERTAAVATERRAGVQSKAPLFGTDTPASSRDRASTGTRKA
ncbi:MAG: Cu(I)-responsive transcriptional regulator [Haliea salexigens]|jgi:Cu(I)-responsive transcriptional regulator|tara:strand:- start:897 stop:1355 length:459 start_codon:yes stop_codon:yes gene_type:complete